MFLFVFFFYRINLATCSPDPEAARRKPLTLHCKNLLILNQYFFFLFFSFKADD